MFALIPDQPLKHINQMTKYLVERVYVEINREVS